MGHGNNLLAGVVTEARSAAGAAAVQAVLNGASVSEAYRQQGIVLPPAGTPLPNPVSPWDLRAGDVGICKDHMVMALGNRTVLASGQVQPVDVASSGPDFLGWFDPTTGSAEPEPAEPTWAPARWWRVVAPDGSLWCETSDEDEARDAVRPGDTLHRLWRRVEEQWRQAPCNSEFPPTVA